VPPGAAAVVQKIIDKGEEIRQLKAKKPTKEEIAPFVADLLTLKAEYKELTGTDYVAPGAPAPAPSKKAKADTKVSAPTAKPAVKPAAKPAAPKAPSTPAPAPAPASTVAGVSLPQLDAALASCSYLQGFVPSKADRLTADKFRTASQETFASYPNVARWLRHIRSFPPAEQAHWQ
jgi:glutathione S-transferase